MVSNIITLLALAGIFYVDFSAPDNLTPEEEERITKDILLSYLLIALINIIGLILGV